MLLKDEFRNGLINFMMYNVPNFAHLPSRYYAGKFIQGRRASKYIHLSLNNGTTNWSILCRSPNFKYLSFHCVQIFFYSVKESASHIKLSFVWTQLCFFYPGPAPDHQRYRFFKKKHLISPFLLPLTQFLDTMCILSLKIRCFKKMKNGIFQSPSTEISHFEQFINFELSYAESSSQFGLRFLTIFRNRRSSFEWVVNHLSIITFKKVIPFLVQQGAISTLN